MSNFWGRFFHVFMVKKILKIYVNKAVVRLQLVGSKLYISINSWFTNVTSSCWKIAKSLKLLKPIFQLLHCNYRYCRNILFVSLFWYSQFSCILDRYSILLIFLMFPCFQAGPPLPWCLKKCSALFEKTKHYLWKYIWWFWSWFVESCDGKTCRKKYHLPNNVLMHSPSQSANSPSSPSLHTPEITHSSVSVGFSFGFLLQL